MSNKAQDWPEGVARHVLERTDSTMMEAARLAPQLAGPAWILALEQTAARGRRGRAWQHPKGNFSATLVIRPWQGVEQAALYSFVAALALDEALAQVAGPYARLSIKWPNDVLLNGGKIAGILLESLGAGGQISHLAIGIGVNLREAPDPGALEPGAMAPVSLRGETGTDIPPTDFLPYLARAFAKYQAQFESYGFAPIRTAWLARAARLGETVTARTTLETVEGRFETINESGAMVLATSAGPRAIAAADIFF